MENITNFSEQKKLYKFNKIVDFFLGFIYCGFGLWIINGIFERNPFYDGYVLKDLLRYLIPGSDFLRPILMVSFNLVSILVFWNKLRYFAIGVLTLSLLLLWWYINVSGYLFVLFG